jgi:TRAP-type C4-dicarboxylate transport system substrate-binding protein
MIKFKMILFIIFLLLLQNGFAEDKVDPKMLEAMMQKFNVKDRALAEEIALYGIRHYGIKNLLEERMIDKIAEKYNLTVKDMEKLGKINIKIGTLAPANTPWIENAVNTMVPFLDWHSRGTMTTTIYPGGVMGEDTDIIRKMALGQLHGCGCTALGVFTAVPEMSVFNLPFLFRNYDEVDHILKKFRKDIDNAFEKRGYILLSMIDTGFFYLYTKNRVNSFEDLKKLKAVTWFGEVEKTFYNEIGMNFLPVSVPEIVMSLQTGIIDTSISPPLWWMGTQAFQFSKYFIKTPFFYSPAAIFLSKKQVEKINQQYPPGMGEEVTNINSTIMRIYEKEWNRSVRDFEKKCQEAFKKTGIQQIELGEEDIKRLESASRNVWYKLAGKLYSKEFLDKILKELEEFRKKQREVQNE